MAKIISELAIQQEAALPSASAYKNQLRVQGGKLWFSGGTAWIDLGATGGGGGGITVETQDSNYTFVAGDSGKCKASSVNGTRTYTIPNSTFSAGDILYVSFMGNVSTGYYTQIVAGSGFTLYRAGTKTASSAYVYGGGLATIFFTSSSAAIYSGPGVA